MISFLNTHRPDVETYWRAIILFGNNVATYKFALGKALLELAQQGQTRIALADLAVPYSKYLVEHVQNGKKQITSPSSRFITACQQYVNGEITHSELVMVTERLGFNNVIDAFHKVNRDDVPIKFFEDDRRGRTGGIILTDELMKLAQQPQHNALPFEIEARWNLVETAWDLNISRNLIVIRYDLNGKMLFTQDETRRRIDVTSSRSALNGYQKGKCFYCFKDISVIPGEKNIAEVDHFLPHVLVNYGISISINGVWNLVLACPECNRNKSARLPAGRYLNRLHSRNEFYIESHHPLRETLISQTGRSKQQRIRFLSKAYRKAKHILIHEWEAQNEIYPAPF